MPNDDLPGRATARRWVLVDGALVLLALVLAVTVVVVWTREAPAAAGDEPAQRTSAVYREVTAAATEQAAAFLEVDHRDMEAVTERVLAGATGDFAEQYAASRERLVARVERARAVVTSATRVVGVAELDDQRAVVLVAADSAVRDRDTGEEEELRKHRMRLVLEQEDDAWLVSELGFAR